MAEAQLEQLIRKTNQIAANYSALGDSQLITEKVYEHLAKFWSPLMKQQLRDYVSERDEGLSPEAYQAAKKL